jgi:hypothetical protein
VYENGVSLESAIAEKKREAKDLVLNGKISLAKNKFAFFRG